jgi:hypothetical protein
MRTRTCAAAQDQRPTVSPRGRRAFHRPSAKRQLPPLLSHALSATLACASVVGSHGAAGLQSERSGAAGRAYFMLSHAHVASPTFATTFASYDLFVAPKELPAEDIARVHEVLPGARVLAYYG